MGSCLGSKAFQSGCGLHFDWNTVTPWFSSLQLFFCRFCWCVWDHCPLARHNFSQVLAVWHMESLLSSLNIYGWTLWLKFKVLDRTGFLHFRGWIPTRNFCFLAYFLLYKCWHCEMWSVVLHMMLYLTSFMTWSASDVFLILKTRDSVYVIFHMTNVHLFHSLIIMDST